MTDTILKLIPDHPFDNGLAIGLVLVAVACFVTGGSACFYLLIRVGKFFGPKVTTLADGHHETMKCLRENGIKQTILMDRGIVMMSGLHDKVDDLHEIVRDNRCRGLPAPRPFDASESETRILPMSQPTGPQPKVGGS